MARKSRPFLFLFGAAIIIALLVAGGVGSRHGVAQEPPPDEEPAPGAAGWAVAQGLAITEDAAGFSYPTAIAVVPQPGSDPKDPRYFVGELRGAIKVVTNDGSVSTFDEGFTSMLPAESFDPATDGNGLAGLCLAPDQGYVYATFADPGERGVRHNHLVRFRTAPGVFGAQPTAMDDLSGPISDYAVASVFQIGGCVVTGQELFVGLGDGDHPELSRNTGVLLGKVLRMNLDGQPVAGNPFFDATAPEDHDGYVWAYGFRNPFGLAFAGDRLFVAEDGIDVDRFLSVEAGRDYLWNGQDWTIGTNAAAVLAPSPAFTHVAYAPPEATVLPSDFRQGFFVGAFGASAAAALVKAPGVIFIPYDLDLNLVPAAPRYAVAFLDESEQAVVAVAPGPGGIYWAPFYPDERGFSPVLKLAWDKGRPQPHVLERSLDPEYLMAHYGCLGCHNLEETPGASAPSLGQPALTSRLVDRLGSEVYRRRLQELDQPTVNHMPQYRDARRQIIALSGNEQVRAWVIHHLLEPAFDNPQAGMPNLGLTQPEAQALADFVLRPALPASRVTVYDLLERLVPDLRYRHLLLFLVAGFVMGVVGMAIGVAVFRRLHEARTRLQHEA